MVWYIYCCRHSECSNGRFPILVSSAVWGRTHWAKICQICWLETASQIDGRTLCEWSDKQWIWFQTDDLRMRSCALKKWHNSDYWPQYGLCRSDSRMDGNESYRATFSTMDNPLVVLQHQITSSLDILDRWLRAATHMTLFVMIYVERLIFDECRPQLLVSVRLKLGFSSFVNFWRPDRAHSQLLVECLFYWYSCNGAP